jgi:hypothetical protein
LHLLAHKHRFRYRTDINGVRLAAGAVNPSRTEENWEPGYNLARLQLNENEGQYSLRVESYLRRWQDNPDRFVAKRNEDDEDVFVHIMPLRRRPSQNPIVDSEDSSIVEGNSNGPSLHGNIPHNPVPTTSQRDLVFEFWQLSPSERRKIMQWLNLLEPSDDQLPEPQRYRLAFERARERMMIDKLEEAINQMLTKK